MTLLWFSNKDLELVVKEANKWYPLETGGLLLGYKADNGEIVVTNVTVSGPEAIHRETQFVPDYSYDQSAVEKIFNSTNGVSNYLGDWHTHPNGNGCLSRCDKRAMRTVSKSQGAFLPSPVMGILFGGNSGWRLNMHGLSKEHNRWLPSYRYNFYSLQVNDFDMSELKFI